MPKKKTIRVACLGPVVFGSTSYWEDVWIQYHIGKKRIYDAPCIMGTVSLDDQIAFHKRLLERHGKDSELSEEMSLFQDIKRRFALGERLGYFPDINSPLCNIVINETEINKSMIEETLTIWLEQRGILKSDPRFQWQKYKGPYIVPVCLG